MDQDPAPDDGRPYVRPDATGFSAHADGRFDLAGRWTRCALGFGGVIAAARKREGDGCTPQGVWPMRRLIYRADREAPPATGLPITAMSPNDGWCDDPANHAYNQPVKRPYGARCEAMWRDDALYDLVVVLGYNDDPPRAGLGSAIFLHLMRADAGPTQGCIALSRPDLLALLERARPDAVLSVVV